MSDIRKIAYCPHCGNKAPQKLLYSQVRGEKVYFTHDGREEYIPLHQYVALCETCDGILIYTDFDNSIDEDRFHLTDLSYPATKKLHRAVPKEISDIYDEASRISDLAPNAFAVQIRRALEAICNDRGIRANNLQSAIQQLVDKGEIPPVLAEATDILRLIGNIGAHWKDGQSVHPMQVYAVDDFFRAVVEYVYVAPSKLSDFKEQMTKFQKLSKEREDNKKTSVYMYFDNE